MSDLISSNAPPRAVLTPPETEYKLRKECQDAIDDTIYKLTIHFSYAYEDIVTPLQHFLKYYSFMHPECSNVLEAYENVDFCRERFCYVDYIKWKQAQKGETSSFSKKQVNDMIREKTVEVQQINDSMQEQLDNMSQKASEYTDLIEKLKSQYQTELQAKKEAEKQAGDLQNDMRQLNKELDRLRNEVQLYREQEQSKQQEKQEEIYSAYQKDGSKPSDFSIFKDSLKDDIARIYSTVKESLPKIESSDNDEEEEAEEEIYATNLPPATEFESKFGQSLFPRGTFSGGSRPASSGHASSTSTRNVPRSTTVVPRQSTAARSTSRGGSDADLTPEELARAEKEMEDAMMRDSEQDYESLHKTNNGVKKSNLFEDVSLEAIENDISSKEVEWNTEFEAALKKAQGDASDENPFSGSLDISSQLSNIDLDGVLKKVGSSQGTKREQQSQRRQAWAAEEEESTPSESHPASQERPAAQESHPEPNSREARRRRRMMEIPEHEDWSCRAMIFTNEQMKS